MKKLRLLIIFCAVVITILATGVALVTQPFISPEKSTVTQADAAQLRAHVNKLSVDFYPRDYQEPANLNRAAAYIEQQFRKNGATTSIQTFEVDGVKYANIIGHFGSTSDPVLVIGAHYDAVGNHDHGSGISTPGADDNASGVAGLLELARLLGQSPPKNAIELVAYTLEEPPFFNTNNMGSAQHAQALAKNQRSVKLMISLEMIGYFDDEPNSQRYPLPAMTMFYPDRGNFIALVGQFKNFSTMRQTKSLFSGATDLPVYSINAPAFVKGVDFSDHRNYWALGYPAIMITDTAFFRNRHYHQSTDTGDKLDYEKMSKVVSGVYAIAQHF